jgi:large subunit ribosomal protein L35
MNKNKTHKGAAKRIKLTGKGKMLRRHQLAKGHLREKKRGKKTQEFKKSQTVAKVDQRKIRRLLNRG